MVRNKPVADLESVCRWTPRHRRSHQNRLTGHRTKMRANPLCQVQKWSAPGVRRRLHRFPDWGDR